MFIQTPNHCNVNCRRLGRASNRTYGQILCLLEQRKKCAGKNKTKQKTEEVNSINLPETNNFVYF